MFSLNNFVSSLEDIPSDWIFEYYLHLPEKLTGQNVRMQSLFNPDDRDPSMYLYYVKATGTYKYKCFSTGKSGNAADLMAKLWGVDYKSAIYKIIEDYQIYLKTGIKSKKKEFVETKKLPVIKKIGWYLDLRKRDPKKALPNFILKALQFSRVKD